ncbi:hypothetical protein G6F22_018218 [Rhizopus arrhizus]|nr:hypothetical protein G6F22_018218 [Rhizopus arrhizus]
MPRGVVARHQARVRAFACEGHGACQADALGRTRDEHAFSCQLQIHEALLSIRACLCGARLGCKPLAGRMPA